MTRAELAVWVVGLVMAAGCTTLKDSNATPADADTPMDARIGDVDSGGGGCVDADGDGHADATCGGDDCDDANANRYPGNVETCESAGIDEDCNPTTFAGPGEGDSDSDGFVSDDCCNMLAAGPSCGGDCDDADPSVNPSAADGCGRGDEDCDGDIDENPDTTFYRDVDGDAYGVPDDTLRACTAPDGYVALDGDCDDTMSGVNPGRSEVCDGSVDENCSGSVDEMCPCTIGEVDDSCGPADETGACRFGTRTCGDDGTWGECLGAITPTAEVCNGGTSDEDDEDCDGTIDEAGTCECTNGETRACRASGATHFGYPSICNEVFQACSDGSWPGPCADEPLTGPMAEICDGSLDQDCDGVVDDGCDCTDGELRACSSDTGECTEGTQMCSAGSWSTCTGDLPNTEVCDHLDQNCNGLVDDGASTNCTWGDTTALHAEFECLPGDCSTWAIGDLLDLGDDDDARVAYLDQAVDWPTLWFAVSARVRARRRSSSSVPPPQGWFGVLLSPRAERGSDSNHGMPRLDAGESGWAAVYDTLVQNVRLYELRDGADPIARASSAGLECPLTTSSREFTVELSYAPGALGGLTASVRAPGCGQVEASVTLTTAQFDALYGHSPSHPTYYPGVLGDDRLHAVQMLLEWIDVERSWGCDGCPW